MMVWRADRKLESVVEVEHLVGIGWDFVRLIEEKTLVAVVATQKGVAWRRLTFLGNRKRSQWWRR
jgi:hypothetical protein